MSLSLAASVSVQHMLKIGDRFCAAQVSALRWGNAADAASVLQAEFNSATVPHPSKDSDDSVLCPENMCRQKMPENAKMHLFLKSVHLNSNLVSPKELCGMLRVCLMTFAWSLDIAHFKVTRAKK